MDEVKLVTMECTKIPYSKEQKKKLKEKYKTDIGVRYV